MQISVELQQRVLHNIFVNLHNSHFFNELRALQWVFRYMRNNRLRF